MPTGRVKWYNETRGYGFITVDDDGGNKTDIFFHVTSTIDSLEAEDFVNFEEFTNKKGKYAGKVSKI